MTSPVPTPTKNAPGTVRLKSSNSNSFVSLSVATIVTTTSPTAASSLMKATIVSLPMLGGEVSSLYTLISPEVRSEKTGTP